MGARVDFKNGKPQVTDGPYSEAREVVGGFWIIDVKNKAEAIEWMKRVPFQDGTIEIRQVQELSDFEPSEAIERERQLGEKLKTKK